MDWWLPETSIQDGIKAVFDEMAKEYDVQKINLYCNDRLEPSSSDKNEQKFTDWAYDGSGEVDFYVNQRALEPFSKVNERPTYIWLLESKQIIQPYYDWILANYDFVAS